MKKTITHPNIRSRLLTKTIIIHLSLGFFIGAATYATIDSADDSKINQPKPTSNQAICPASPTTKPVYCDVYYQSIDNNIWVEYKSDFVTLQLPSGVSILQNKTPWFIKDPSLVIISVDISKEGPTQLHETEPYDGIYLSLVVLPKNGQTLQQITEKSIDNLDDWGNPIDETYMPFSSSGYTGFKIVGELNSKSNYFYIEKNPQSQNYMLIADHTRDPSRSGFDIIVNKILSELTLTN